MTALSAAALIEGLQQFMHEPREPFTITIHPRKVRHVDRLILAPARRKASYAAGRRLARHVLRGAR